MPQLKNLIFLILLSITTSISAQDRKTPSKENINSWLNSPQVQEWASKPEMQAFISMFAKHIFVVNGRLFGTDEFEPKPYPLQGAHIEVTCVGDTTQQFAASTNSDGEFLVPIFLRQRLKTSQLHIKISYIGMQGVDKVFDPVEVKLLGQKVQQVELDSLVLRSDPMTLAEVEIVEELKRMYQRGDTVIFNADAYEMPSGSVLLDLVRRLPGLQYMGGKLTYMNRDIEEIRLNGDNFFKRDMSAALQNMPPDKLKSLKVYEVPDDTLDVMSDQHLVMDMSTKGKTDVVMFGNAGISTTGEFNRVAGNIDFSRWKKESGQTRVKFDTSNIPARGSLTEKEVKTNASATHEQTFGDTKVEGGLNYGYTHDQSRRSTYNRLFMPEYTQNSRSETMNGQKSRKYSANIKLDGKLGTNLFWNTQADFTKSEDSNWSSSSDSIYTDLSPVSTTHTTRRTESDRKEFNWRANLTQYFGSERQTEVGINANFGYNDTKSTSTNSTDTRFYLMGDSLRMVNHLIDNPSRNNNFRTSARFGHRFGEFTNLRVNYEFAYNRNSNSQTYNDVVGTMLNPIDSLHYDNRYKDVSHGPSLDFKYDNKQVLFQLRGKAQPTVRTADNTQYSHFSHNEYSSVQYQANARFEMKMKKNKLTLTYNGANTLPTPNDISTAIDYSDPMNIRRGNPDLKEAFRHQFGAEYQLNTLMRVAANYNRTDNQQTTLSIIDHQSGVRTSMPTNINGNWGANSYIFLTKPVHDVTLAALANYAYNHGVSYVQDASQISPVRSTTNWQHIEAQAYATYSNKSVMMIARLNYSQDYNKNDYLATATRGQLAGASLNMEYQLPLRINLKLKTDFNFNRKFGYELASANRSEYLWNASTEYRFLDIVTASLEWRDILRSQRGFNASMSATGWSETQQYGNTSMLILRLAFKLNRLK